MSMNDERTRAICRDGLAKAQSALGTVGSLSAFSLELFAEDITFFVAQARLWRARLWELKDFTI